MASPAPVSARRQPEPITPVLLASARESDRHVMQDFLGDTAYVLVHAANWNAALNLAGHIVFPVILYDRLFDIADWQLAVKRLVSSWQSPSVLLLSPTSEEGLRRELIRSGGFDVLLRPLRLGDVLATMDSAIAHFARRDRRCGLTLPRP